MVYADLDGTLLGQGGSLFRNSSGRFTMAGAQALQLCHRAGLEISLVSGRNGTLLAEDARLLGINNFIGESGCFIARSGGSDIYINCAPYGEAAYLNVFDEIASTGAPALLISRFAPALTYHDPWYKDHQFSHLLRGQVSTAAANALLAEAGFSDLKLIDNGVIEDLGYGMPVAELHAYHLIPRQSGKGRAIELDRSLSGIGKEESIACGDSAQDLEMAPAVGTFYLMSNAAQRSARLERELKLYPNVVVVEAAMVEGFLEAVEHALTGKHVS